jgi:hypothetical protein
MHGNAHVLFQLSTKSAKGLKIVSKSLFRYLHKLNLKMDQTRQKLIKLHKIYRMLTILSTNEVELVFWAVLLAD